MEPSTPRSLWLEEALAGEAEAPRLEGDLAADVCIAGGGYTGLWTALRLKELDPALDVVLVERDVCGGGASGRNGGFVLSLWAKFKTLARRCGEEEALRLARASAAAVAEIGDFCAEHAIDADFRLDGWLWTATSEPQAGAWSETVEALERVGERPFREVAPDELAERTGSRAHLAGVFEATAATVQPALLARGLRRVALERGVRIFERSPVTAIERSARPRVRTPAGSVTAERLVLAQGAWMAGLRELRPLLLVIASDMVATGPIPDALARHAPRDGVAVSDSRLLVGYYRTTRDRRIAFGKGGGALGFDGRVGRVFEGASPRAEAVAASLWALHPPLREAGAAASWTGPIDRSPDALPFFGRLPGAPAIAYGVGYSGNGVGPCLLGGRVLASLALGREDEWSACGLAGRPPGRFPPEPARYVGGLAVRAAVERKERAEDEGRAPSRLDLALARLAPPGLVPTRRPVR